MGDLLKPVRRGARPADRPGLLLDGGFGFAGLLAVGPVVLALELLDAAGGIDVLHLAGEERVAGRADFDGDILLGAAGDELVATAAGYGALGVLGMNPGFHGSSAERSPLGRWETTIVENPPEKEQGQKKGMEGRRDGEKKRRREKTSSGQLQTEDGQIVWLRVGVAKEFPRQPLNEFWDRQSAVPLRAGQQAFDSGRL